MSDRTRIVIAAFTFVIAILTTGHIEWLNYNLEKKNEIQDLKDEKKEIEK